MYRTSFLLLDTTQVETILELPDRFENEIVDWIHHDERNDNPEVLGGVGAFVLMVSWTDETHELLHQLEDAMVAHGETWQLNTGDKALIRLDHHRVVEIEDEPLTMAGWLTRYLTGGGRDTQRRAETWIPGGTIVAAWPTGSSADGDYHRWVLDMRASEGVTVPNHSVV